MRTETLTTHHIPTILPTISDPKEQVKSTLHSALVPYKAAIEKALTLLPGNLQNGTCIEIDFNHIHSFENLKSFSEYNISTPAWYSIDYIPLLKNPFALTGIDTGDTLYISEDEYLKIIAECVREYATPHNIAPKNFNTYSHESISDNTNKHADIIKEIQPFDILIKNEQHPVPHIIWKIIQEQQTTFYRIYTLLSNNQIQRGAKVHELALLLDLRSQFFSYILKR